MNRAGPFDPAPQSGHWRSRSVFFVLILVWLAIAGRLVQLQWFDRKKFAATADRQRTLIESIPARPGEIVDRRGRVLATTISVRSLFIVPSRIKQPQQVALRLSEALGLNSQRLLDRINRNRRKQFLWVKRRLDDTEAESIKQLNLPRAVWGFRKEFLRRYPQGALAAHVLGLRDIDGIGRGGLEERYDNILRGRDGRRVLVRDARGGVIDIREEVAEAPKNGRTLVLTIDSVIQLFAERELDRLVEQWKPKTACITVLDPRTGEVLAMSSRPTFDPNNPGNVPPAAWKNTNIAAVYEPGSTFKPFIVAWGLENGLIRADETFHCENGEYLMGRRLLHDHHPYGELNVTDILVKSSNIGMAKIGERMTNAHLYRAAIAFGFGRKTGSMLPGELSGIVRPLKKWDTYSTGSVPMGQEIAVTPLQLLCAHAALANGGRLLNPRMVLRHANGLSADSEQTADYAQSAMVVSRVVSSEIAHWLIEEPMQGVVERGTGKRARLEDYSVFGKTGTAQKPDPRTGAYSSQRHVSSFVCGAPVDDPQVLILVVVDEPSVGKTHYGGTVAAPTAAAVLRKTLVHLHVPADDNLSRSARR